MGVLICMFIGQVVGAGIGLFLIHKGVFDGRT